MTDENTEFRAPSQKRLETEFIGMIEGARAREGMLARTYPTIIASENGYENTEEILDSEKRSAYFQGNKTIN